CDVYPHVLTKLKEYQEKQKIRNSLKSKLKAIVKFNQDIISGQINTDSQVSHRPDLSVQEEVNI
ncbi:MAG: hypothetical protein F6K62_13705, partial [Sphaerospermopsis sp. SIO1G2]|nr:hypothetical protein [Sphaerospermopsis sp. SIO1G2]